MEKTIVKNLRYDIHQTITVADQEYELINYIEKLRKECRLTKSNLSLFCGHTTSWFSQFISKDGRKKNVRQSDLNNLISVLIYGVRSTNTLSLYSQRSENYIRTELHALPLDQPRDLYTYEKMQLIEQMVDSSFLDDYLQLSLELLQKQYKKIYSSLPGPLKKQYLINLIHQQYQNLSHEPFISLHYYSFPYSMLFTALSDHCHSDLNEVSEIEKELFRDLNNLIQKYTQRLTSDNAKSFIETLIQNLEQTYELL